jgi:hypothetical protein
MLNLFRDYQTKQQRKAELSRRFAAVHDENLWGSEESRSGPGSARHSPSVLCAADAIRKAVDEEGIRTMSDIPCGDFNWMPDLLSTLSGLKYTGFDIVFSALHNNKTRYPQYEFRLLDVVTTIPPGSVMIFCKDLLNHLKDQDVNLAIANMKKSGSKFLLASNNGGFVNTPLPEVASGSRYLDITAPPFGYKLPMWTLEGYLSLWRLQDIGEGTF